MSYQLVVVTTIFDPVVCWRSGIGTSDARLNKLVKNPGHWDQSGLPDISFAGYDAG